VISPPHWTVILSECSESKDLRLFLRLALEVQLSGSLVRGRFMRLISSIAVSMLFVSTLAAGQQPASATAPALNEIEAERVKVYTVGPGVTPPEFLPASLPPIPAKKCENKADGRVEISLLVDTAGRPRNLMFTHPLGNDLDKLALQIVAADRFGPATNNGAPVVMAESAEVSIQACAELDRTDAKGKIYSITLRSQPVQKFRVLPHPPEEAVFTSGTLSRQGPSGAALVKVRKGGKTTAPVPLNTIEAPYTPEALKAGINGACLVSLIIDTQGMPQDLQMVRSLDPGLDQNAITSVSKYRFKPAMSDGEPVPVRITVEVNFRPY
jgi:TonB family protein